MASEEDTERDWANLPPELVEIITETLTNLPDYIRFRAVCTNWRSSSRSPPRRFVPWLLLSITPTHYHFLNSSENWKPYFVPIPSSSETPLDVYGSGHGFLILEYDHKKFSLVNPLLPLTSFHTLPPRPKYNKVSPPKFVQSSEHDICCSIDNNFIWRLGDSSWTLYDEDDDYIMDFIIYKGRLYLFMDYSKETDVLDPSNFTRICKIQPPDGIPYAFDRPDGNQVYLVEEPSNGDLLMVVKEFRTNFSIFKLDLSQQPHRWLRVNSIGDIAIFLDVRRSFCFPANNHNGLKGNCVYIVSRLPLTMNEFQLFVHNIVDGTTEELLHLNSGFPIWFPPSLS